MRNEPGLHTYTDDDVIDPELRHINGRSEATDGAESFPGNIEVLVGQKSEDWHGGGRDPSCLNPYDGIQTYEYTNSYEYNPAGYQDAHRPGQPHISTYTNTLTDGSYPNNSIITVSDTQGIFRSWASSTSLPPGLTIIQPPQPITATNQLLENPIIHDHVLNERGDQQTRSQSVKGSPTNVDRKKPLTLDHLETQKLLKLVEEKDYLSGIILYIVDSDWYQKRQSEQLPPENLRKAFQNKKSSSSANSPFSAFFEHRPGSGHHCLFCINGRGRSLERALGHARGHFNFKPINGYTNQNTKNDQLRRAQKPIKHCIPCKEDITSHNYARHIGSEAHKRFADLLLSASS